MTLTTDEVRALLYRAKSGTDADAALQLIAYFRERLSDGGDFDRCLMDEYLLHAFERICGDQLSADQAFGLRPLKGKHQREDNEARNIQIAAYVEYLKRFASMKWDEAIGCAANEFFADGSGDRAAKAAHAKYKSSLSFVDKSFLKDLLPENLRRS